MSQGTRAYRLAEELGLSSSALLEKAEAAGIEVRNGMSALDGETANRLRLEVGGQVSVSAEVEQAPSTELPGQSIETDAGAAIAEAPIISGSESD